MCGILGGTDPAWDYDGAVQALRHRGPDRQRVSRCGEVTLGFARLAIIDLSEAADQPMSALDGQVWLVFNGEIYGYAALRQRLLGLGYRFRSQSDTEVLLNAYLHWGDGFVEHVDGMFAAVLYDARRRQLKLFRDRPGIKPLYYYADGRRFAFASELKGITALLGGAGLDEDPTAIYDFLTYRYIPAPKTLYRNVFKLEPASWLTFDLERRAITEPRRYWRLEVPSDPPPVGSQEAAGQLTRLLEESVDEQLVADVPVGFFLSGGVDSSTVVAAAARSHDRLETFCIGFDRAENTETPFAREVARAYHTDHHERTLSFAEAEQLFSRLKDWYDEPFYDSSAFPTYLVSKFARESVTVALTGDGGDEVFGGYLWHDLFRRWSALSIPGGRRLAEVLARLKRAVPVNSLPYRLCDRVELMASDDLALYAKLLAGMSHHEKRPYAERCGIESGYDDYWHFRRYWRPELPLRTRLQYLEFHTYLPDDILTKVDRVSMAVSLEARVPLLSRKLVEFSFALPEEVRYCGGQPKGLLKRACVDRLPPAILQRRKQGFSMPRHYRRRDRLSRQERVLGELFGFPSSAAVAESTRR